MGAVGFFFTNVANAILRAEGDARRAMWAMLLGGVMNIVLDPIFIYTFGMGLAGIWWGLVIGNTIGVFVSFLWARSYLRDVKAFCEQGTCGEKVWERQRIEKRVREGVSWRAGKEAEGHESQSRSQSQSQS